MDIQKEREAFEKQGFLSFYLANLIFDEAQNVYKPNESLIRTGEEWEWRAFKNQTVVVNTAWAAWQARARAQAVPEGFALLPKIPSEKLIYEELEKIFPCSFCHDGPDSWKRTYIKVIEAAQQDVFQTQEPAND